jgi:catechol 2,3-dioxygenase-like lactoylglutathione lyase family enzyme
MTVKRIVTNIASTDLEAAKCFYGDVFGLDLLMDHGWVVTGARHFHRGR